MTHSRRHFLHASGAAALGLALPAPSVRTDFPFDLLLRGGTLLDGTGAPAYAADVAIVGDTIAALGTISPEQARRVVDVAGLQLAPGFIDIHSHSDATLLIYPGAESRVTQGVTTEVAGNCGGSAAPLVSGAAEARIGRWVRRLQDEGNRIDWTSVASYCARVEAARPAVNHALLLGQGTLREAVAGVANRPLTPDELGGVLRLLEQGLDEGAFGLSTGLEYEPGRYTPTEEIVITARVVARRGGLYASHTRNEEALLLEAVDEAIEIGRRSGGRVEISHLKAAGQPHWPKQQAALDLIESARRAGVAVLADAYPYTAYASNLTGLLPGWALDGGAPAMRGRLSDATQRAALIEPLTAHIARDPGSPNLIVISRVKSGRNRACVGRTIAEIGESWAVAPAEAVLRLIEEEEGGVGYIGHGMSDANVARVLAHPLVMVGSDGYSYNAEGRVLERQPHPRFYGSFARVLGRYCRERGLFDLPTAVRKMTAMPADQLGLRDRGRIAKGKKADLAVFDAARVADVASFEATLRPAVGFVHVLVNGVPVVESGRLTGARPGRVLRS